VQKKLALITPWPPQASGIADYAYDLASCIIGPSLDLHVITTERAPVALAGVSLHHIDEVAAGALSLSGFDGLLLQLGNHPHFHGYMLDIIRDFPCTVELHDLLLHHCVMGEAGMSTGGDQYYDWLNHAYGNEVMSEFKNFLAINGDILQCPIAAKYPCSDVITANAKRVIVHSHYAKNFLELGDHSSARSTVINLCQRADDTIYDRIESEQVHLGVFGGVQTNRQVDSIVAVLSKLNTSLHRWTLDVVGAIDDDCLNFLEMANHLGVGEKVTFHGRLPLAQLNAVMQRCDVVVSLRNPTMGETSGIVVRAMQMGKVSVVSDVGWYSELPDCVIKVDNLNVHFDLEEALLMLLNDRSLRVRLAKETAEYASQHFDLRATADDILFVALNETNTHAY